MAAEVVLFSESRLWVSKLVSKLETGNWIHEKTSFKLLQQVSLRASITLNKNRYSASERAFVAMSRFIQIIGQISRLPRSTALRAEGCASLEMTTKWIPSWLRRRASPRRAHKPPILPNLSTIYNLIYAKRTQFSKKSNECKSI
ncbi:MAG: hypothetical protein ACYTBX_17310 [Planctomycetota bacterium]|jgi:hypothetical protein